MDADSPQPVLILGAGVNGAALARELVLNGVPVCVVDINDVACGASSKSTRLIHGGLRYLEYGDFRLVKESLDERSRLRKLAPHFVKPVRLFVPVRKRFAGLFRSAFRFLGGSRFKLMYWLATPFQDSGERGLWLVRLGLWLYDRLAGSDQFPNHSACRTSAPNIPRIDASQYHWMCAYTDAQMYYPERFILALLEDARGLAAERQIGFDIFTYHRAELEGTRAVIRKVADGDVAREIEPAAVVNATGAWGDLTLKDLKISSRKLFGGTRGSHLVTFHDKLRDAIGDDGLYAEAGDGRLIFVLPFGTGVLIGTTDERFGDRPEEAIASGNERDYLLEMTNNLFPNVNLTEDDIELHYSGIRPLPHITVGKTASVPRGHWIEKHENSDFPLFTLVGGKLTTARAFAEDVANALFERLGIQREADTRNRPIPGGKNYPLNDSQLHAEWCGISDESDLSIEQIHTIWSLCGNRIDEILNQAENVSTESLDNTNIPIEFVRWCIKHEWVATLDDLVERRLLLLYHPNLTRTCLEQLSDCLIENKKLYPSLRDQSIQSTADRLEKYYGKKVVG